MTVRLATVEDLPVLDEIYERARRFMRQSGNLHQWTHGFPSVRDLKKDIDASCLYVIELENVIQASFVYYQREDPCYRVIYDGAWLNEEPYAVLHRVATRGLKRHMGQLILAYAFSQNNNVRIDTHEDNKPMQRLLETNGFRHVGTILLENGDPRWAYHWTKDCIL